MQRPSSVRSISRPTSLTTTFRGPTGTFVACAVVVLVSLATWWTRLDGPIDLRWDGGAYYILGTSLADGHGYRLLSEPGGIESSLHPPLLPFLVAASERVLGSSDPLEVGHVLRLMMVACSAAYAVATYLLLGAYLPRAYALAATLLGILLPQTVYFSDSFYAEPFFGLFSILFFIFYRHRERTVHFLLAGLCAVLAYEARSAGIALLAAWVIDSLIRKDFKRGAAALAISLIAVLSWLGWIRSVESSPEYRHPAYAYQTAPYLYFNVSYARNMMTLQDPSAPELGPLTPRALAGRVWGNVGALPVAVGRAVSGWETPSWQALPLAMLVFAGTIVMARRRRHLMLLYLALSLAAVCSTPFQKAVRSLPLAARIHSPRWPCSRRRCCLAPSRAPCFHRSVAHSR